jgi:hypothetical protein
LTDGLIAALAALLLTGLALLLRFPQRFIGIVRGEPDCEMRGRGDAVRIGIVRNRGNICARKKESQEDNPASSPNSAWHAIPQIAPREDCARNLATSSQAHFASVTEFTIRIANRSDCNGQNLLYVPASFVASRAA